MTDLTKLTLTEARDGLRAKKFSSKELTTAFNRAIEKGNPHLNAYVLPTPEQALAMAQISDNKLAKGEGRPLEGVPLGIKDLFATKGVRTTACSKILGEFKPTYESTVTQNLWDAGAVMLGKLNNDEFAMGSSNETSAFGPVVNPWRRTKDGKVDTAKLVPGGSSGGSSSAVSADLCLAATATDTGGSIRQPAAFTGTVATENHSEWSQANVTRIPPGFEIFNTGFGQHICVLLFADIVLHDIFYQGFGQMGLGG